MCMLGITNLTQSHPREPIRHPPIIINTAQNTMKGIGALDVGCTCVGLVMVVAALAVTALVTLIPLWIVLMRNELPQSA